MTEKLSRRRFIGTALAVGAAATLEGAARTLANPNPIYLPQLKTRQEGLPFNFVVIVSDTFRYDHVGILGNPWISTPNIDAFAVQSSVFTHARCGGFPTVLNRAEILTGKYMYRVMGWDDLPPSERILIENFKDAGYVTGLVFDTWHWKDHGFSFDRAFDSWEWIRGQEGDRYRATPPHPALPAHPSKFRDVATVEQYLRNQQHRLQEEDYQVARTVQGAVEWLQENSSYQPFFLHVDIFNPHEPWDPPGKYVDLYDAGYQGDKVIYPAYKPAGYLSAAELNHVRALYAGQVTMVDHWVGRFLQELDASGLSAYTVVVLASDHGFLLGEHGFVGKEWIDGSVFNAYPLYEELAHIPLMIRIPGQAPGQYDALVQPTDILPTLLDLADIPVPEDVHGLSLRPLMEGRPFNPRTVSISSRSFLSGAREPRITVCDGKWTLLHGGSHANSWLYNLVSDPGQANDLLPTQCAQARALHGELISFLEAVNTPDAAIDPWRQPPC